MNIIRKALRLDKDDYYLTHVRLVNTLLGTLLSNKEVEVLSSFLSIEDKFKEDDEFSTYTRKIVKDKLNLSDGSLTNHIRHLKEKGFIKKKKYSNKLIIPSFVKPEHLGQGYQIKLIKK